MPSKLPRAGVTLWMVVCVLCAASVLAQQKRRLQELSATGDVSRLKSNLSLDLTLKVTEGGEQQPSLTFASEQDEQYSEAVLAAENGKTTAFRRTYTVSRTIETDMTGQKQETVSPLQGKTVTARRRGGKVTVTVASDKLDEATQKSLVEALNSARATFYPKRAVGPGDEWELRSGEASRLLGGAENAAVKGRFVDEVQFQGHPCARIGVTVSILLKSPRMPAPMQVKLEGYEHYATDIQRSLSVELSGPVMLQREALEDGVAVAYTGEGTMRLKVEQQWSKIGGKPVATKAGAPN